MVKSKKSVVVKSVPVATVAEINASTAKLAKNGGLKLSTKEIATPPKSKGAVMKAILPKPVKGAARIVNEVPVKPAKGAVPPAKHANGSTVYVVSSRVDGDGADAEPSRDASSKVEKMILLGSVYHPHATEYTDGPGYVVRLLDEAHPEWEVQASEDDVFPGTKEGRKAAEKRISTWFAPRYAAYFDSQEYYKARATGFLNTRKREVLETFLGGCKRRDLYDIAIGFGVANPSKLGPTVGKAILSAWDLREKDPKARKASALVREISIARMREIQALYGAESESEMNAKIGAILGQDLSDKEEKPQAEPVGIANKRDEAKAKAEKEAMAKVGGPVKGKVPAKVADPNPGYAVGARVVASGNRPGEYVGTVDGKARVKLDANGAIVRVAFDSIQPEVKATKGKAKGAKRVAALQKYCPGSNPG